MIQTIICTDFLYLVNSISNLIGKPISFDCIWEILSGNLYLANPMGNGIGKSYRIFIYMVNPIEKSYRIVLYFANPIGNPIGNHRKSYWKSYRKSYIGFFYIWQIL